MAAAATPYVSGEAATRVNGVTAPRVSGVFAPITSLPSPHGVGDMGAGSRDFVDLLHDAGQKVWQILPTTEPGNPSNSPYDSHSPQAINRWLIAPDDLVADGLLTPDQVTTGRPARLAVADAVDYGAAQRWKAPLIESAADNLLARASTDPDTARALAVFERENAGWLPDYANFMQLKKQHAGDLHPTMSRATWPIGDRVAATAVKSLPTQPTHEMRRIVAEQFIADRQWKGLRDYAGNRGIKMMSDLPFYEGGDSVGTWKKPELFHLDSRGAATKVGGAPPEPAFPKGQAWGMPAYRSEQRAAVLERFAEKVSHEAKRVGPGGYVRLDHLLGAADPYLVPVGDTAATTKAGFEPLFSASEWKSVLDRHPEVTFVGEDLGGMTPARAKFMNELDPPRMRVGLQSLLETAEGASIANSAHFADNVGVRDVMFAGGTHDYPFLKTYLQREWSSAPVQQLRKVLTERGYTPAATAAAKLGASQALDDVARGAMQLNFDSRAQLVVTQVFDALGMGGTNAAAHLQALNVPGTVVASNWATRLPAEVLEHGPARDALKGTLMALTEKAGRLIR